MGGGVLLDCIILKGVSTILSTPYMVEVLWWAALDRLIKWTLCLYYLLFSIEILCR